MVSFRVSRGDGRGLLQSCEFDPTHRKQGCGYRDWASNRQWKQSLSRRSLTLALLDRVT